jgi:teichuronic acid exporter
MSPTESAAAVAPRVAPPDLVTPPAAAAAEGPDLVGALDRSLLQGVAWNGVLKLLAQGVAWMATLFVARHLTALDYGIYGVAVLVLGVVQMLTEFGIGTAVVTRRTLTPRDFAELNTVSVALGAAGAVATCLLAPVAGLVFRQPRVVPVVATLSLTLAVGSFRSVPWALMQRDLRFRRLAVYDTAQMLTLAALSVALATLGFGYWTLVLAAAASTLLSTAVTVAHHPVPFARPDLARLRSVLVYSRDVVLARLSWYAYMNVDFVVAGRLLGTTIAGYYGLAWTLAHLIVDKVAQLVFQVTPGVLSRVQESPGLLRRYFTRITAAMTLVFWPLTIGLALVAEDFVPAVLGPRWEPIVFPLRVLSVYSSVWILLGLVGQLLLIVGEEAFARRNNLQQLTVMTAAFIAGANWGLDGIALAWLVMHPPFAIVRVHRLLRRLELPYGRFANEALLPAFVGCAGMALAVLAVHGAMPRGAAPAWRLAAAVSAGSLTYVVLQVTIFRRRQADALDALRGLRRHGAPVA